MIITSIASYNSFRGTQNQNSKPSFLEKFHENVKNSSDLTDTIVVPRTIFKGYLGIMTGTTLVTLGSLISNRLPKMGKTFSITGLLASLYGTYAFVRPYIIKDAPGVQHQKSRLPSPACPTQRGSTRDVAVS